LVIMREALPPPPSRDPPEHSLSLTALRLLLFSSHRERGH